MNFILRIIVNAIAIGLAAYLLPGIRVTDNAILSYLLLGLIFGIVNALVKPIVSALTCPLIILTLGLFILVINGAMLWLTAQLSGGRLQVDSIVWAIIGGVVMGVINVILEAIIGGLSGGDDR
jgi:putative membrane protein